MDFKLAKILGAESCSFFWALSSLRSVILKNFPISSNLDVGSPFFHKKAYVISHIIYRYNVYVCEWIFQKLNKYGGI